MSGNLNSHWPCQPALQTAGGAWTATYATSVVSPPAGFSQVLMVPALTGIQALSFRNWAAANGGSGINGGGAATKTNRWTLVMDLKPTFAAGTTYTSLLQTNALNSDDAEIFLHSSGSIYINGSVAPAGTVVPNTWQRFAFTCDNDGAGGALTLRAYRNGSLVGTKTGEAFDGRYSIGPTAYFFADDNNETNACEVNAVGFWTETLTAAQITAFGGPSASNLTWAGQPAATECPGLSGRLMFGAFEMTLPASGFSLANGQVILSPTPAYVAADADFTLGGTHAVRLAANGDLIYTGSPVMLAGPPGGATTTNGVSVRLGTVTVYNAGASADGYSVTLPIGLGCADSTTSRRLKNKTLPATYTLNSSLIPNLAVPVSLPGPRFGLGTTLFVSHEAFPVRLRTSAIEWFPASGQFRLSTTSAIEFDRKAERTFFNEWKTQAGVLSGGDERLSNDDYFSGVNAVPGIVRFTTDANGIAQVADLRIDFASTGFKPHFPRGPTIRWLTSTSSKLEISGSALTADSYLADGIAADVTVPRDCPAAGCPPAQQAGPKTYRAAPSAPADHWAFTSDGGLRALCNLTVTGGLPTVEWGALTPTLFAHQVEAFPKAWFMMPGCRLRLSGPEAADIALKNRPAALLLSGVGNQLNGSVIERPGLAGYENGVTDYAGLNFRPAADGDQTCISRLGGSQLSYPLRAVSKYYARLSGVTARHEGVADPLLPGEVFPTTMTIAGYSFGLSEIRLSYRDSENIDSSINGALSVPAPANLTNLSFKNLRFGCRGELLSAEQDTPAEATLDYWKTKIKAYAFQFALPAGDCPSPSASTLVLGVEATLPALTPDPLTGNIGLKANGHTVTPADNLVLANGEQITSRLRPPVNLRIKGPGAKTYPFTPFGPGVYLNEFTPGNDPFGGKGFAVMSGEMDVPFFQSLRVVLWADSSSLAVPTNSLRIFQGDTPGFDYFSTVDPDPTNKALPPAGVNPGSPRARKLWLDMVNLDLPLTWNDNLRRFNGNDVTNDLLLFTLNQRCKTLGPDVAELTFGVTVPGVPQINTATLLDAVGADTSGLIARLAAKPGGGALTTAITKLTDFEQLLGDTLAGPFDAPLDTAMASAGGVLYDQLAGKYQSVGATAYKTDPAQTDAFFSGAQGSIGSAMSNLLSGTGGWTTAVTGKIQSAIDACNSLRTIVQNASQLAGFAAAVLNNGTSPPADPITELAAELDQALGEVITRLTDIKSAFASGGELQLEVASQLGSTLWISSALVKLQTDWVTKLDNPAGAYFPLTGSPAATALRAAFVKAFQDAVREAFHASVSEQNIRSFLASALGDAGFQTRGAFDGVMQAVDEIIQGVNPLPDIPTESVPGSDVASAFKGAKIQGYARINGDSLHELRLDGDLILAVPDEMKFRAWFILRDVDATMPGGACLAAGGLKTEVTVGAAAPFTWLGKTQNLEAEMRLGIGASGAPVSVAGSLGLKGELDLESVKVRDVQFGLAIGLPEAYLFAKAAGSLNAGGFAIDAEAAVFFGKTCRLDPIEKVDPNIVTQLTSAGLAPITSPLYGMYAYAYGDFSVLSLIGIPPSCLLDIRVGGGLGPLIFFRGPTALVGMKMSFGVRGEALCLVNVSGRLDGYLTGVMNPISTDLKNLKVLGRLVATLTGEIGIDPFSFDWDKSFYFDITLDPGNSPKFKWDVDY